MIVQAVKPNPSKPETGFVKFEDGTEAWTPAVTQLVPFIGKDFPADWLLRDGPKGKQLLPPKEAGKGGGYRQGKEAFDREQVSIHRSVALQYAVELSTATYVPWLTLADEMFAWLESSGTPPSSVTVPAPRSPSAGDWGEQVEAPEPIPPASASPPPSSPPSPGEGVGGSAAGEVGNASGEGAEPASLAKLVETYGTKAKVMRAAKIFYRDDPTLLGIENLSEAQALELVEAAHRPVPDA